MIRSSSTAARVHPRGAAGLCAGWLEHDPGRRRKRPAAGRHLVEHDAEAEQVVRTSSASPRACSGDMYATVPTVPGPVTGARAWSPAGRCDSPAAAGPELGHPEVEDLGRRAGHEDVGGLDVAVDDAPARGRRQGVGDLDAELRSCPWPAACRRCAGSATGLPAAPSRGRAGPRLVDIVDVQMCGWFRLSGVASRWKRSSAGRSGPNSVGQELDATLRPNRVSPASANHAHPAAAQFLQDAIVGEAFGLEVTRNPPIADTSPGCGLPWSMNRPYALPAIFRNRMAELLDSPAAYPRDRAEECS